MTIFSDRQMQSAYLAAAEGYPEENYNMIDSRIDTQSKLTPGNDISLD